MSAAENLNNAIAAITRYTPASPVGVRKAVDDLGKAWDAFWRSPARATIADPLLSAKYKAFLQWYARAYLIVPTATKAKCPDPRYIDVSWSQLATDTLRQTWDVYRNAAREASQTGMNAGGAIVDGVTKVAGDLSRDIARAGAGIAAPITAYGQAVRDTVVVLTIAYLAIKFAPNNKGA